MKEFRVEEHIVKEGNTYLGKVVWNHHLKKWALVDYEDQLTAKDMAEIIDFINTLPTY